MFRARIFAALTAPLLFIATVPSAQAQVLRGIVVEQGTGLSLPGAVVVLLDADGQSRGVAFTDAAGRFGIRAPEPGRYTVRVDRIGYASVYSVNVDLAPDEDVFQRIEVTITPVALDAIEVRAGQRCVVRPGEEALETARVWEQARAALTATVETERQRLLRFDSETWRRRLDARSFRVTEEQRSRRRNTFSTPFRSGPAEELIEDGFIREIEDGGYYEFYAPDANVLLSDAFLDTHCFRLTSATVEDTVLLGLGFEPVGRRDVPDVEGTLWLDPVTAALHHIELTYVARDPRFPIDGAGARVEFQALPDGRWFISRWHIRMPSIASERVTFDGRLDIHRRVIAFWEEGGEVTRITTAGGAPIGAADRYVLSGTVFDSTRGWPLGHARVVLEGTALAASADVEGRFSLGGVPAGEYTITVEHARLDTLPESAKPRVAVTVESDRPALRIAVPAADRLLEEECPAEEPAFGREHEYGVLVGTVTDPAGRPVPDATVRVFYSTFAILPTAVAESERLVETTTGEAGRYVACPVPIDLSLRLNVELDDRVAERTVRIRDRFGAADIELPARRPAR